jgi:hypothetical protein
VTSGTDPHGELVWGVKASLLAYVLDAGGTIEAGDGARWVDGVFRFASVPSPDDVRRFTGSVAMSAHSGQLDYRLRDPEIRGTELHIAGAQDGRTIALMRLQPEGSGCWRTFLTLDGSAHLQSMYEPGTEFDMLRVE